MKSLSTSIWPGSVLKASFKWLLKRKWWIAGTMVGLFVLMIGPAVLMRVVTQGSRFAAGDLRKLPDYSVAIVFGAGVLPDGQPTPYLQRRLDSAIDLYKAGKVDVLLLSADNSTIHHNEPIVMKSYAMSHGVDEADVVLDYAGLNTYDSCYRAKAIFGVHEAIVVSQAYHLPRAVWTCNHLGVKSVGVAAKLADGSDGHDYTFNYLLREIVSADKAVFQVIFKPKPTFLGKFEPIGAN